MAQTLRLKRSSVPGRVPTTATLQTGEIAINTADGLVYIRKDDDSIIPLLGVNTAAVTGDVILLGSIEATSFTGSFSGSFNGPITGTLSKTVGSGDGIVSFLFDGSDNVTVSLNTGSAHFIDGVNDLISVGTALSASYAVSASYATSASYAENAGTAQTALTASYTLIAQEVLGLETGSFVVTGSVSNATITLSQAIGTSFDLTVDNVASASFASSATSAATAATASTSDFVLIQSTSLPTYFYVTFSPGTGRQAPLYSGTMRYEADTDTLIVTNISGNINSANTAISASYANFATTASYATNSIAKYPLTLGAGLTGGAFDGSSPITTSIETSSTHFIQGVRSHITASSTTGASGINLSFNTATGELSGSIVNASMVFGTTEVFLGGLVTSLADITITGSFLGTAIASGSFSGSFQGSIDNAVSASHALIADYALNANVDTGSLLQTGSIVDATITLTKANGTSFDLVVDNVASASYAAYAANVINLSTGSFMTTGSISNATITFTKADESTFDITVNNVESASYAATASSADDFLVRGDLTVDGIVTAREFHTTFISASIVFKSGSTKFGDSEDDVHEFTGSILLSGSINSYDISINDWGSVSASLATISASAANITLQQVTNNGNSTNLVISASNLNITGFPDVSASLAELYNSSASFASELTLVSATASAAYNFTLQDITDNGNSTNLVISASNLNITGFPDVSASLANLESTNTLQGVTDNGNTTTNQIIINNELIVSQSIYSKGEEVLDFAVAMEIALG